METGPRPPDVQPILQHELRLEHDVVFTRQRARQLAALLGFDAQDQTRIATAVSEIARNAYQYAGGGRVAFVLRHAAPARALLCIQVRDQGPGIPHLAEVERLEYQSPTGMGRGIVGARRLMDEFRIEPGPSKGTVVTLCKKLPRAPGGEEVRRVVDELLRQPPRTALEELQQQNRELLQALEQLRARQDELLQLNRELEDTNRGVVALYAELDEKAFSLARANDVKTRFLSNMTHEFRTPLNSILSLAHLLLDRMDGPLTPEQERQIEYIRRSAENLSELVNDLLDLAKVQAGKVDVRPGEFRVADLFATLRGMLKPLLAANQAVNLTFEPVDHLPPLCTDENKVAQILRNFISNALKYTESGEVRVTAEAGDDEDTVTFAVADTGIGIAPEDQERIFEEYTQIDSPLQRRRGGTGLGLPLSRELAGLLGGRIWVRSAAGYGSTFYAAIPRAYRGPRPAPPAPEPATEPDPRHQPVLVVDDDEVSRYLVRNSLAGAPLALVEARNGAEGLRRAREDSPCAIILDLRMPDLDGFAVLDRLKADPATRAIPVIVHTGHPLTPAERARLARAAAVVMKPGPSPEGARADLLAALAQAGAIPTETRPDS